jgi:hypothetical protein
MPDTHLHFHINSSEVIADPEPVIFQMVLTFRITDDDKEHQDAVKAQIVDSTNRVVFDKEIVPATGDNGNGDDPNAYYWPSDGDGKHFHSFPLTLVPQVPLSALGGSKITLSSYTYGGHSDFESWTANVDIRGVTTTGDRTILLNGQQFQGVHWNNDTSPGPQTFSLTLGAPA